MSGHTITTDARLLTPQATKQLVDTYLSSFFETYRDEAAAMHPTYRIIWDDITQLFHAGGKRFRPYMTLLVFSAYSDKPLSAAVPAAAAQELLHLAMLMHDDIIDRDDIRYGVKNITARYLDHYENLIDDKTDLRHFAQSAAILAGDLLFSEAYHLISLCDVSPEQLKETNRLMHTALFDVIGGELLDTEASFRGQEAAHPLVIARQKTASYSFVMPFQIGAALAGAGQDQRTHLDELAQLLGIGYQIRDDIMGVFGDATVTGKSTDGDLLEGKRTLLIEEFYHLANNVQRTEFAQAFGKHDATPAQIARAKALLEESGARASIEETIADYQQKAEAIVDTLNIGDDHKAAFRQLIDICLQREK